MDTLSGLPMPDRLELIEHLPPLPCEAELPPDPTAAMLDLYERSVEQAYPAELEIHTDDVCRTLDLLEAVTERQGPSSTFFMPDLMLDRVEASIEQQSLEPAEPDEEPASQADGTVTPLFSLRIGYSSP